MRGFYIGARFFPYYGCMIALGIVAAGIIGFWLVKRYQLSTDKLVLLSTYGLVGGLIGAKVLYLMISWKQIQWELITDFRYLNHLLGSGFVFYGGLIGGVAVIFAASRIHKIELMPYLTTAISCLPIAHGFGRIGCFMASCCYGIPYDGWGSIVYQSPSFAPVGVPLFPVQLLEALLDFILAGILIWFALRERYRKYTLNIYLAGYFCMRFGLEYLRYDSEERGIFLFFSTSQWVSILGIIGMVIVFLLNYTKKMYKK